MFSQELLRIELARRIRAATAGPGAPASGVPVPPDMETAQREAPDVAAIAVLRRFDPETFARSALEFALGVREAGRDWFRAFTRTVFLAGNPTNLRSRFPGHYVSADGSMMWFAPVPQARSVGLRRLLKRFDGAAKPVLPPTLSIDLSGPHRGAAHRLEVATAGVTVADYLVHVNHILAEAVLTQVVRPGDRLELSHVPRIGDTDTRYSLVRVHRDTADQSRLRAYAALSPRAH